MRRCSFALAALLLLPACSSNDDATSSAGSSSTSTSSGGGDPLAAARKACTFTTGARVRDTLGLADAERSAIPIEKIVVLMKENRSFDHLLGVLHDHGQPDTEAIPASFSNLDESAAVVTPHHEDTTCISHDPDHQWFGMHVQVNGGAMSGFVTRAAESTGTDGHFALGYYEPQDLPFDYWLANTFALEDRHFASVRSGTFPNRNFLLLGTADGVTATGAGFPDPATPTLFDALDAAGKTWGVYSDGSLLSGTLNWTLPHPGAHHFADFIAALDDGSLPDVAFVDGIDNVEDEHPTANLQQAESWTRNVYQHALTSPLWKKLAMVWTFDEGGGFFDHVPPPADACVARPVQKDQAFHELGVRVPLVAISPWARPHAVSHVIEEHTAITRFIETVFDLPALTARDANSTALLDLFDFTGSPPLLVPPTAPAAGAGGCVTGVVLTTDKPNYAQSDAIHVAFTGAKGAKANDRIAVYPYPATGPTPPNPSPLLWAYIGGTQSPGAAPVSGSVTLDASALGSATWPLPVSGYIAYYLVGGGYESLASIDFNVH
jgi:phospholipase C